MIRRTISHYQILEELGAGGMSVVYKALDARLGRKVALKFLRGRPSAEAAERLLREAQTASALDHPNICTVYEIAETAEGRRFIAMAHYEGEDLSRILERGALPLDEAVAVAVGAARGLHEAHRHGIVHQDVKPHNLMRLPGDEVKILDFGIAQLGGRPYGNPAADMYGTISYMAPERFEPGYEPDPRSDVWSLGVVLYEMAAGVHPFERGDPQATAEAIRHQSPPPIAAGRGDDGAGLDAVLAKALQRDLGRRYPDMGAMLHDLEALARLSRSKTQTQPVPRLSDVAEPSIAVLPFADKSPEADQEHLCFGIAEELVRLLTTLGRLRVASFLSTRRAAEQEISLAELSRRLGVEKVLEGSVHKAGDRLRVVVRLLAASDGRCLWSEKYDRRFEDLFDLQDEIAERIVLALEITLMGGKAPSRDAGRDLEAHDLFLKGRYYWNKRTEEGTEKGIEFFRQAISREAGHARAWAGLADSYAMQGLYSWHQPDEVMPRAREAADRALASDGALADVYASRASLKAVYDWDFEGAERDYERAIELDPSYAVAYQWYAMHALLPRGRFGEARRRLSEARKLDPLSLPIVTSLGIFCFYRRRWEEAIAELERALEIDPGFVPAHLFLGYTYTALERWAEAWNELEVAEQLAGARPDILAALGRVQAARGANDEVKKTLDRLYKLGQQRFVSPSLRAQVYAALGRPRAALDALKAALEVRAADLVWLGLNPFYEPLHREDDFQTMLAMIGLDVYGPA